MHCNWIRILVVALLVFGGSVDGRRRRKGMHVALKRQSNRRNSAGGMGSEMVALQTRLLNNNNEMQILSTASGNGNGSTSSTLINAYNTMYSVIMTIGGKQQFTMLVDTGSSNMWVPSVQCTTDNCLRRERYNSSLSKTYVANGTAFQIQYATHDNLPTRLAGFFSEDSVEMAGLTVPKQVFAEITSLPTNVFNTSDFDGILGLGFQEIAVGNATPFLYNLVELNLISQATFSFYLERNNTGVIDPNGGRLQFGPSDPTLYRGCLTYVPVSRVGYWQFTVGSISVGGNTALCSKCQAVVDVGTSLIVAPRSALLIINDKLNAKLSKNDGVYILDCASISKLPNITFNIGRRDFILTPQDYVVRFKDVCVSGFSSLDEGSQELTSGSGIDYANLWILGDTFMGSHFMEFDLEYKRVGIATKV